MVKKISSVSDLATSPIIIPPLEWQDWGPDYGDSFLHRLGQFWPQELIQSPVLVIDIETNKVTGKIVGLGVAANDENVWYWPNPDASVVLLLQSKRFIGHNLGFDLDTLDISRSYIYWDTYLGSATEDPTKDTHSLKALCESELGLKWPTYEQMTRRKVLITDKRGKQKEKVMEFTLEEIQQQHPDEVARYNGMDLIGSYRLAIKQMKALQGPRADRFRQVELPISSLCQEMKNKGIQIDREGLRRKQDEQTELVNALRETLIKETGNPDFNPNAPGQVLKFLQSRGHAINSTGEETIRPLGAADKWVTELLTYRGAFKLLNTYILPLLEYSAQDGRIHTNFNQIAMMANGKERPIITGRFSSSNPINLQNQPPEVKEFFIPEDGYAFVCADYSQIDLRSLAHLSQEPVYCEAFRRGHKVHQAVADQFGVEYKLGKIISLALAYNGGPGRLMQEAQKWGYNLDYWQCKQYSDDFINRLSTLTAWKEEQYAKAKRLGGVQTLFGRWIPLPYPEDAEDGDYAIKHWQNCVIAFQGQGGTADIVKGGMLRLRRLGFIPNAQVHDELLLEVPEAEAQAVAKTVKYELENVMTLRVPLVAEVGMGKSWKVAKP